MKCDKVRERLSVYIDGALDARGAAEIERHVAGCGECRRELAAMRRLVGAARGVEFVTPPAGLTRRIREAVAAERSSGIACDAALELVSAYVDGELTPDMRSRLEAHTALCGACEAQLRQTLAIAQSAAEIETVEPPAGLRAQIAAAVGGLRAESLLDRIVTTLTSPRAVRWTAGAAAAAVITIAVIVATPWEPQPVQTVSVEPETSVPAPSVVVPSPPASDTTVAAAAEPSQGQSPSAVRRAPRAKSMQTRPKTTLTAAAHVTRPTAPKPTVEEPELTAERPEMPEEVESVETTPSQEPTQVAVAPAPAIPSDESRAAQPTLIKVAAAPQIDTEDYDEWFAKVKDQASMRGAARRSVSVSLFSAKF